jgi:hypothetical protein
MESKAFLACVVEHSKCNGQVITDNYTDGICRACDQNHSFQQDFEGVKANIDDIPKLFQAIKALESV